jgi:hypothetical protein
MVARVIFPLVLVATALISLGIVYPTLNGPFRVDCGQASDEICEQLWREAALHEEGITAQLPVTRVRVTVTDPADPQNCATIYIERWIFSTTIVNECVTGTAPVSSTRNAT